MSHWCLLVPPFVSLLLYFLLLLLLSLALLLLLPFILLLLSFHALLLLSFMLHVVIVALLHCAKGKLGKKIVAVLLILATSKTLGQFDIFPFNPYPLFE
jgi:hypothetical protein